MSNNAAFNPDLTAQIVHPRMRVFLAPTLFPGGYDEDGNEKAPQWDRELADDRLIPMEMHWGSNGEPTVLAIRRELGAGQGHVQKHPDDLGERGAPAGSRIRLFDADTNQEWFAGNVAMESLLIQADPQQEAYTLTAYGPELRLKQKAISGQWFANKAASDAQAAGDTTPSYYVRENIYQTDLPCVFNPGGRANCGQREWKLYTPGSERTGPPSYLNGQYDPDAGSRVFVAEDVQVNGSSTDPDFEAVRWTPYTALRSLIEYIDNYDVISISSTVWGLIYSILGGADMPKLGEVDVDGLDLLAAIRKVLGSVGFGFTIEPWSACSKTEPFKHRIQIYSLRTPNVKKRPYLPPINSSITDADGARGEIQRLHFVRDDHNVRNDITVLGQRKRVQVKLQYSSAVGHLLYPCWVPTDYALSTYMTSDIFDLPALTAVKRRELANSYSPSGDNFQGQQHVWRSFCLNEDGALTKFIATIPDLAAEFGLGDGTDCARIPRPVGPTIEYADATTGGYKPARVTLTAGSPAVTVDITSYCTIWPDRAGFTITGELFSFKDEYDPQPWRPFLKCQDSNMTDALREIAYLTLLHNTIRESGTEMTLALVGTIEDDQCISSHSKIIANSSWPFVAKKTVRVPVFRKQSVDTGASLDGTADTRDDSTVISNYADQLRDATEDQMGHGSLMLPMLSRAYPPGIGINETAGRRISLHVDGGKKDYYPTVHGVRFNFGEPPSTEVLLDSPMLRVTG